MTTHLSLFTGIGGLDMAAEAAGMVTVGQCEWADYPTKVLEKHWPDVPRWRDIRTLTGDDFYARTGLRTVDVISGGFPCQPFSVAGKQKGKGDDRYLWPEMLRVIAELGPRWVVGENVPGILRIAAADVVADLERLGYHVVVFAFEAAAVGAYHRRERVAFVAHNDNALCIREDDKVQAGRNTAHACGEDVANTNTERQQGEQQPEASAKASCASMSVAECCSAGGDKVPFSAGGWPAEPDVGRVAHGIPNRVDRLKCLGNAVVPAQFYPIFKAIVEENTAYASQD